jgi:subtilisin family serine protease
VDVCAPGTWTSPYVTGSLEPPEERPLDFAGWATWQGTSFATPYVIGRIAALVTADGISPLAAAAVIKSGPVPFPGFGALVA